MKALGAAFARWTISILMIAVASAIAFWLWSQYEFTPWTRDGHVRADVVRVSADVGGLVTSVAVRDNQHVEKGQLLYTVDVPRYTDALDEADARVASAEARLAQARRVARRDLALGDLVATEAHEANTASVETASAMLKEAQAARETAALNVHRTQVHASVSGQVTNLDLHPGDFLAVGAQALALVDENSLRVEAYLEETKLRHVEIGARARVRLMGDAHDLEGHVESIAGGISDDQRKDSGNLLPAVQPTFSWVRLAQRIPVRIHIDRMPPHTLLIAGRTATVTIDAGRDQP